MDKDTINQLEKGDSGKVSGIFLVDKPVGITSHDVVDEVRRIFHTKAVGHAGTLDPFASGLLILLVGKYTKKSDEYMGHDKTYEAEVAFGISTDSHDPEGKLMGEEDPLLHYTRIDEFYDELKDVLERFKGETYQGVPVYSSVKINGDKLRELARKYDSFDLVDGVDSQTIHFKNKEGSVVKEVTVPKRKITIRDIEFKSVKTEDVHIRNVEKGFEKLIAGISVSCSKGTYIRQLAYDIGHAMQIPSMLVNLRRTKIGEFDIKDALTLDELRNVAK